MDLKSKLCIGIDPEWEKLPEKIKEKPKALFMFSKNIIDATFEYAVAYKPNIAFFERFGSKGISEFEELVYYSKNQYPEIPIIADCKRGDLANTSKEYAKYFFGELKVDSITLSPYMGEDSIQPYLEYSDHFVFLLCLTSNPSSSDLQRIKLSSNLNLYEYVANYSNELNKKYKDQIGIVVGATHPTELAELRKNFPELVFLIPGYGAQGGSLEDIMNVSGELSLINSSRSIIFASNQSDFSEQAKLKAKEISFEMRELSR
jgi:orotidine-5'-phosphate decarboxylase